MKLLSFDVGIKNLAYCIIDSSDRSIEDWGILNISIDPLCDHKMKHKCCDKSAKKIRKEDGFKLCTSHCKLKQYQGYNLRNIPKLENPILSMGEKIVKVLDEQSNFLKVDLVCIENQPALKNPVMKTVQMILYSYFLIRGISTDKLVSDIQMINARNKLKVYKGPKIECDIKDKYKRNKFLAIQYCEKMIHENPHIHKKYHELYENSKKKDDLSDAYLQGIYVIDRLKN